ncbi:MAG: dTDP-4-amino-4,6-dideoxygalactose transaminase [Pseudomonadota bacterium]|nr:dTDP-4-amino-4,6-dideoxygalactose transaminase [Pseudomonadota bacterium]
MSQTVIPYNKPFIVGKELYYIANAVLNGQLSGNGMYTKRCQQWLKERIDCKKALLTHSCTAALEMAAILCNIQPGDEIIMPSFTFVSTANAFVLRGGVPVFIDIRMDNLNMDESLIENAITEKTKAIVPVHYAGVGCEMEKIMAIAEKHKLYVIEDAAQGLLSCYKDRPLGSIGHFGCLSFHETKNIISGEGGALLINDPDVIDRAEIIWEKGTNRSQFFRGQVDKYTWVDIGSSFLPSELIAAFLYAQLEKAEMIIAKRRSLFARYMNQLRPLELKGHIRLPYIDHYCESNGHIFYVLANSLEVRDALMKRFRENDINAIFHYVPLHSSPAGVKYGRVGSAMNVTDDISDRLLRLPLYFEMTDVEVDRVIDVLSLFFAD